MDREKVLNLAKLARIEMGNEEAEKLSHEFDAILDYVGEVKKIGKFNKSDKLNKEFAVRNVMREDTEGHEPGIYTEKILNKAPSREGNYIKVKKIL
ncbi:MAG: Asp-tRNA(Asn)/Glu-tRNA(Gln) amidotransferase subunit GatC [Patescibacteria group bacterium]